MGWNESYPRMRGEGFFDCFEEAARRERDCYDDQISAIAGDEFSPNRTLDDRRRSAAIIAHLKNHAPHFCGVIVDKCNWIQSQLRRAAEGRKHAPSGGAGTVDQHFFDAIPAGMECADQPV